MTGQRAIPAKKADSKSDFIFNNKDNKYNIKFHFFNCIVHYVFALSRFLKNKLFNILL